jgi:hypothetical protein
VGADRTLRSWDLTIGGKLTATKLKQSTLYHLYLFYMYVINNMDVCVAGNIVRWSPSGKQYAVVSGRNIDIYNTAVRVIIY